MVDGYGGAGRYTAAQRHRLYRLGVREFFRLPRRHEGHRRLRRLQLRRRARAARHGRRGDRLLRGRRRRRRRLGRPRDPRLPTPMRSSKATLAADWLERQALTLELAERVLCDAQRRAAARFTPIGRRAGLEPRVLRGLGRAPAGDSATGASRSAGMVPLKTMQILDCLEAIGEVREPETACTCSASAAPSTAPTFRALGVHELRLDFAVPPGIQGRQGQLLHADGELRRAADSAVRRQLPSCRPASAPASSTRRRCAPPKTRRLQRCAHTIAGAGHAARRARALASYESSIDTRGRDRAAATADSSLRARGSDARARSAGVGRRGRDLSRHRAQQAPRLSQPLGVQSDACRAHRRRPRPAPDRDGGRR